jgi:hypothetical protein
MKRLHDEENRKSKREGGRGKLSTAYSDHVDYVKQSNKMAVLKPM